MTAGHSVSCRRPRRGLTGPPGGGRNILVVILLGLALPAAAEVIPYAGCFEVASRKHDIPVDLLLAVASVESNWQADARSTAGAHGIMQIRWPHTARHLGARRISELYNPCLNIDFGARYLAELSRRFKGQSRMVLAAYNYGPSRLESYADVPAGVRAYVTRVEQRRAALNLQPVPTSITAGSPLLTFRSRLHADAAMKALGRQLPSAVLRLTRSAEGWTLVSDTMNPEDRVRLTRLLR
ncbi:MAG: lytic transglycosylase domain-containing protein [Proteobacteria bacterium]|jgi:hypothetical protein|nr:lytic transglycosylase domain-containing protein [Pseudomonadota bacterium]MDA1300791.1 lytic transglycosylase domain-containing protein [Pseudomonadota bacterium]